MNDKFNKTLKPTNKQLCVVAMKEGEFEAIDVENILTFCTVM